MRARQLIEELEAHVKLYGDLDVVVEDDWYNTTPVAWTTLTDNMVVGKGTLYEYSYPRRIVIYKG
jgi:hypothetical protein